MTICDPGELRSVLETAFPHPDEEYADAYFCQEMTAALESAVKEYKIRFLETVDEIRAGGLYRRSLFSGGRRRRTRP